MAATKDIDMHFWASQEEYDLILKNMALSGSTNLSAFLRKMAIDGMVIRLNMPEIREMLKLLRRANANINQIAKHLHETGRVYDTDLEEILDYQKAIYTGQNELLTRLASDAVLSVVADYVLRRKCQCHPCWYKPVAGIGTRW